MAKRRITDAKITFISLCKRGKTGLPVLFKAEGASEFSMVVKASETFDEDGEVVGCVYAPDLTDFDGDFADSKTIRKMQRAAARDGFHLDIQHDCKPLTKDQAWVAESFIIAKGDPRFEGMKAADGKTVDCTGGWGLVVKIEDTGLRKLYRSGEWDGFSMFGPAKVEDLEKGTPAELVEQFIKAFNQSVNKSGPGEESDMTPDQLAAALKANNEALVAGIAKAITDAGKPGEKEVPKNQETETKTLVKFVGDPANPKDVMVHRQKVELASLAKSVDWNDPASITKYQTELVEMKKAHAEQTEAAKGDSSETDEVKKARAQAEEAQKLLAKALGRSQQPAGESKPAGDTSVSGISKAQLDLGDQMAALVNGARGFAPAK